MTILAAVADDAGRERVLDVAVDLGHGLDQDVYVVHLVGDASAGADARRLRDEVREYLADAGVASTVAVEAISHTSARPGPRIARELIDAAADVEITHIVMGHAPKGLFERLTEGSTAFAVADETSLPVTIVPAEGT
jgi:nucleotide-binding universal stress UspA family protein